MTLLRNKGHSEGYNDVIMSPLYKPCGSLMAQQVAKRYVSVFYVLSTAAGPLFYCVVSLL